MQPSSYSLFETVIGTCAIAWRQSVDEDSRPIVTHFQLPEATVVQTEARIARNSGSQHASVPPQAITELIEKVRIHLQGNPQDFREVPVDLDKVPPFFRRVYEVALEIPAGQTRTYGEIARALGEPGAAQEVGQALAKNPIPLIVPCHRVLAADGKLGGFSAPGGTVTKTKLLALEGAPVTPPLFS